MNGDTPEPLTKRVTPMPSKVQQKTPQSFPWSTENLPTQVEKS